jgi:hypothetical protein
MWFISVINVLVSYVCLDWISDGLVISSLLYRMFCGDLGEELHGFFTVVVSGETERSQQAITVLQHLLVLEVVLGPICLVGATVRVEVIRKIDNMVAHFLPKEEAVE